MSPGFPTLKPGQYVVVMCEIATGIVLRVDGRRFIGSGEKYPVFGSLDEARRYSETTIKEDPTAECWIQDAKDKTVETFRDVVAFKKYEDEHRPRPPWWKFWADTFVPS